MMSLSELSGQGHVVQANMGMAALGWGYVWFYGRPRWYVEKSGEALCCCPLTLL